MVPCPRCGSEATIAQGKATEHRKAIRYCHACERYWSVGGRRRLLRRVDLPGPICPRCDSPATVLHRVDRGKAIYKCKTCLRSWTAGGHVRGLQQVFRCKECGTPYVQTHAGQRYCSYACYCRWLQTKGVPLTEQQRRRLAFLMRARIAAGDRRLSPCKWAKGERWALDWDACQRCGRTDRPHVCRGYCKHCYKKVCKHQRVVARQAATIDFFRQFATGEPHART